MKNLKKILALVLVIALTATATVGITLALLTDETEIKHNVFTAGNVEISLTEKVDGDTYGGVGTTSNGAEYKLVAPGDELTKEVTVKNEGSLPAYVAVTVTMNNAKEINEAIDGYYEALGYSEQKIQGIYDHIFEGWGLNHTKTDAAGDATGMRLTITGDDMPEHTLQVDSVKTLDEYWLAYSKNWFANASDATAVIPFDGYYTAGMDAYEIKWTYYLELQPGEESTLFTGINVPEYFVSEQMAMFDGLEIDIQGAAIQAENFADAKAAFTALKAEQEGNAPQPPYVAETQQDLNDAIAGGETLIELPAGDFQLPSSVAGKVLTIQGGEDTKIKTAPAGGSYYGLNGASITFEGVTIQGKTSGQYNGFAHAGTMVYNNCTIEGTLTVYTDSVFNNCTFNLPKGCYVWTSWGPNEVTYNNCEFNTAGKALLVYHENGTCTVNVNGCTFNATASDKAGAINNQPCAAIEIDNSGKGVGSNSACKFTVNTSGNIIDSDFSGEWRIKTIDTTGKIVVNGKEYTTLALDGHEMTIDSNRDVTVLP